MDNLMKTVCFVIVTLVFCILISFGLNGLTSDTAIHSITSIQSDTTIINSYEEMDDFSPGIFVGALIGIVFIIICVGIGIALTIIVLLIIFGLISFGVLSASVLVGLINKSFAKGFKTLLVSSSAIGGLILITFGLWFFKLYYSHLWIAQISIALGAILGLISGLIFGLLAYYVLQRLTTFLMKQFSRNTR
jgi:hypothetical protein